MANTTTRAWVNKQKKNLAVIHRNSCIEIGNRVQEGTPVRTGRAKAGWQGKNYSLDAVHTFISNIVYIFRLEYDRWSSQAPNGMVRINLANWPKIVKEQVKNVK